MKSIVGSLLLLFMGLSLQAQQIQSISSPAETYAESITPEDFLAYLSFLADDMLEGRETGERGQRLAAAYIRTQFMRLGLAPGVPQDNSYFQYYYINRSNTSSGEIKLGNKTYRFGEDFYNYRSALPESLTGEFVFGGYGIQTEAYDNLTGLDVKDKIVLILGGMPGQDKIEDRYALLKDWRVRQENIEKMGARAMVMIVPSELSRTMKRYARRRSMTIAASPKPGMPVIYLNPQMGKDLIGQVKGKPEKIKASLAEDANPPKLKFNKLDFSMSAQSEFSSVAASNVLALLEGTDKKEEIIVLTAHYDHIGVTKDGRVNNGADDDGSGTTAILELAEAFAKAAADGNRPRRSLLFMTVSGEEKGLLGSGFYTDHPVYPLENTVANLNIDMIGRTDARYAEKADSANYVYLIGADKLSSELHEISEAANKDFTQITLDYKYNDEKDPNRFYYRSDHYNFAKNDIPVIFYFTGVHVDYHKPTDDVEKINRDKAAHITKLVFHTAWELANREERIVVDKKSKQE